MLVIGHGGAGALAAPNTMAAIDAALGVGADAVELDVLRPRSGGPLLLAHDDREARQGDRPTLDAALDRLAGEAVQVLLDVKSAGSEHELSRAIHARGVADRTLVVARRPVWLRAVRAVDPDLALGRSFERPSEVDWRLLRRRAVDPRRAVAPIRDGLCRAILPHWRLVTAELVAEAHAADGALYAWTADDAGLIERLAGFGVDGVITNDPRLANGA